MLFLQLCFCFGLWGCVCSKVCVCASIEKRNSLLVAILIFICVMRKNKEHGNDNGGFNCLFCARSSLDGWVLLALKARSVVALLWLAVEAGWLAEGDLDTDFTAESVKFGPVGRKSAMLQGEIQWRGFWVIVLRPGCMSSRKDLIAIEFKHTAVINYDVDNNYREPERMFQGLTV